MDSQPVCLTTKDISGFCERMKGIEDKISLLCDQTKEMKEAIEKQRTDFAAYRSDNGDMAARMTAQMDSRCDGICALIGEVPQGESVMGNVRAVNNRVDKMFWAFGIILAVVEFIANFPQIAELFTK